MTSRKRVGYACFRVMLYACTCWGGPALAGDFILPSDVGFALVAAPTDNLRSGEPIEMVLRVTNNGDVDLPLVIGVSTHYVNEIRFTGIDASECVFFLIVEDLANGGYDYLLDWDVANYLVGAPTLTAGDTRVCHFEIALTDDAPAQFVFGFNLSTYMQDPDPSNDVALVTLNRATASRNAVPSLSSWACGILALIICWITSAFRQRRASDRFPHALYAARHRK
ncbi:MAG: hypothetical protein ABIV12_16300 [Dokdonella sp.]